MLLIEERIINLQEKRLFADDNKCEHDKKILELEQRKYDREEARNKRGMHLMRKDLTLNNAK